MSTETLRIIWFSSIFPTSVAPHDGTFVVQRVRALQKQGATVHVISPVGLTPPQRLMLRRRPAVREAAEWFRRRWTIPAEATVRDISVTYPKWFWVPKGVFGAIETELMYRQLRGHFKEVVNEFKPDILIASWLPDGAAACRLASACSLPTIVLVEGSDVQGMPSRHRGWTRMRDTVISYASAVIFVSRALQANAQEVGLVGKRNAVIYNGVDIDLFQLAATEMSESRPTILSVGRLSPEKGHHILLEAFALLRASTHPRAQLVVIGDGVLMPELQRKVTDLGVSDAVRLLGSLSQAELPSHYQGCDVFCLPSFSEGLPCAVLEAMACGKPVVASAVGGVPEVVDREGGLLVAPGDAESLAHALAAALDRSWDSHAIRCKMVDQFTWNAAAGSLIRAVEDALGDVSV